MKYDIARLRRTEFPWADTERTIYLDRKSTRLNSSHLVISYAVFCLKKKIQTYRLTINDGYYCYTHMASSHSVAVHLRLLAYLAENLITFAELYLSNVIPSLAQPFG